MPFSLKFWRDALIADRDRWFLWFPVGIALGVGLYLSLGFEPGLSLALPPLGVGLGVLVLVWRFETVRILVLALVAVALGFAAAKLATARAMAPVLAERLGPVEVSGLVLEFESRPGQRPRAVFAAPAMAGHGGVSLDRLRLSFDPDMDLTPLMPGGRAAVSAILLPPPGPALPGAPDHGRTLWFEGIGAVGYAVKPPRALAPAPDGGGLAIWRQRIAARVEQAVGGPEGAVAAALLVGIRGAVPDAVEERWRAAGISHILSISGLHIGLAAGIVLFGLRFLMALVPVLSLRLPAKKWAAAAALLAAGGYTIVAGMDVPALRSFVMTAVVLLAVMTDRLAITMRLVAIAAVAVLVARPESLVSPGFGMSFASVIGLVAGYEVLRGPFGRWRAAGGLVSRLALVVAGILISSVIATIATAPFAIAYFGRLSVYGLLANLVAVPATAFAVMPLLVLGAIAMPFGLEAVPFHLLGLVIGFIDRVAAAIADLPGAVLAVPAMGQGPLVCFVLGGLWLCLWRQRIRFVGAPIFAALAFGLWFAEMAAPPRLLIHEEGRAVAAFEAGALRVLPPAGPGFIVDQWRERLGLHDAVLLTRDAVCQKTACRMAIPPGPGPAGEIAVVTKGWIPCAAVVVLPRMKARPLNCAEMPVVLDRDRLRGTGTIILSADGRWSDVAATRGLRPWTPAWWRRAEALQ